MKIKYIGKTNPFMLTEGKLYDVISVERGYFRIIDDTNEDYLYPPNIFEIVDHENDQKVDNE